MKHGSTTARPFTGSTYNCAPPRRTGRARSGLWCSPSAGRESCGLGKHEQRPAILAAQLAAQQPVHLLNRVEQPRGLLIDEGTCARGALTTGLIVQYARCLPVTLGSRRRYWKPRRHFKDRAHVRITSACLGDGAKLVLKVDAQHLGNQLAARARDRIPSTSSSGKKS